MMRMLREKLGRLLGRRPVSMQVAALCLDPGTGRVLLITSRGSGRWIIPKGWPMTGRTLAEAALQEAWEEAGVRTDRPLRELGSYRYRKKQDRGFGIPVEARIFAVEVSGLADKFPEAGQRRRRWFAPAQAADLVDEPELKALLRRLPAPTTATA